MKSYLPIKMPSPGPFTTRKAPSLAGEMQQHLHLQRASPSLCLLKPPMKLRDWWRIRPFGGELNCPTCPEARACRWWPGKVPPAPLVSGGGTCLTYPPWQKNGQQAWKKVDARWLELGSGPSFSSKMAPAKSQARLCVGKSHVLRHFGENGLCVTSGGGREQR
ncbi:hypothetical protein EDB81DRAFT_153781 [Dactylonectria macrodidyma]|uniref:Uncharacterized protein n=1 Tax=Dactylonectria macrodidyma TaxID=307937 RepID=A0A9P9FNE7_9HYPO|nr:hypothetical protein EDB81DRAFT_153781 [Dactylonectria macrodidyma]